jgi:aminoglycoside phosphotransferase (APT) family kinase protein
MAPAPDLRDVEQVPHGRTAQRLEWHHLPREVRQYVEGRLGSRVVRAESQGAGFTPGFASRLTGEDGSRLFVKAASKVAQQPFAASYAEEARKLALLPRDLPAPRILWVHQDDRWVVLGFECVGGRNPRRPWRRAELSACIATLEAVGDRLAEVPPGLCIAPMHEDSPTLVTGWHHVAEHQPDWPHLADATSLAAELPALADQDHFAHFDARDDNFVLTADGHALLCDWNWPVLGPRWTDLVCLLVSAHGDGLDGDALLAASPLGADADPGAVDVFLAGFTGYMLESRDRPVPASSPYVRVHARWYGAAAWSWLSRRRGWT